MTDKERSHGIETQPLSTDELRRYAEERFDGFATLSADLVSAEDTAAILHELRVHQIELEMQNEELRRTQLELGDQREKYYGLFDLAPVGYLTLSAKGIVSNANLTATHQLGVERQLLVGQPFSAFVHAQDRDDFYLHQRSLEKSGEPQSCEFRLQRMEHSDGEGGDPSHFWAHLEGKTHRADDGETVCWMTVTDIDELRRDKEALLESEKKYRFLWDRSTVARSLTLPTGEADVNDAFCEMLGYTREELADKTTWMQLTHPEDVAETQRQVDGLLSGERDSARFEKRFLRKDGEIVWADLSTSIRRDAEGQTTYFMSTIVDITARKQAEEALRESVDGLNKAQHFAHLGSWTWNVETDQLDWSDEMFSLFGVDQATFSGSLPDVVASAIHPEDRDDVERANRAVTNEGRPEPLEYRVVWPDESVHWVRAEAGELILDEEGNPSLLSGTVQDISERKQAEAYADLGREILQIFNGAEGIGDSLNHAVVAIKATTGLDAVGIRLQDGEDFPYAAHDGFSEDFLSTENTLLQRDAQGEICRYPDGRAKLECTCGLVICGSMDPYTPMLTPGGGSFWTNDSFPLLDLPADEDPRYRPRNRCMRDGYASMALVPILVKGRTVGLIHLNDHRNGCFTLDAIEHLEAMGAQIGSALSRKRAEEALRESLASIIDVIGNVSEMRDPYTAGHQRRVAELAVAIEREMGMSEAEIADIRVAGLMHDIGKMSVPAEILSKPTALSPIEFSLIKSHSQAGYEIILAAHMPGPIAELVYEHHERCDGSGYPRGLLGEELLDGAKVLAVADVTEAMMSHRPYRAGLGQDAALAEIERGAGLQYDPLVAEACVRVFRERGFEFSEV